jgi:hypothetical protein
VWFVITATDNGTPYMHGSWAFQVDVPALPAPTLSMPVYNAGQVSVSLTGAPGYRSAIRASSNLAQWGPLQTNTSPFTLVETNAGKVRFYRAVWIP